MRISLLPSRCRASLRGLLALAVLTAATPLLAAEHVVEVLSFVGYQPSQITIRTGDTVVWNKTGAGEHNVVADDGSFTSGPATTRPWTLRHTFTQPGVYGFYCTPHGGPGGIGMSGRILVEDPEPAFAIHYGLSGGWYNAATPGQGFFIDVSPELDFIFVAWFTWNVAGADTEWYTAQGAYQGNRAVVPLIRTTGGRFDDPAPVVYAAVGEAEFIFESCTTGVLNYRLDDIGRQGTIPLRRLLPVPDACEDTVGEAIAE